MEFLHNNIQRRFFDLMQKKLNIKGTQKKPILTEIQRGKLEAYLDEGNLSKAEIARRLGVCRATIYNEIKRKLLKVTFVATK